MTAFNSKLKTRRELSIRPPAVYSKSKLAQRAQSSVPKYWSNPRILSANSNFCSFDSFFKEILDLCVWVFCMYVYLMSNICLVLKEVQRGFCIHWDWIYGWQWATMWRLGTSSVRTASVLKPWASVKTIWQTLSLLHNPTPPISPEEGTV